MKRLKVNAIALLLSVAGATASLSAIAMTTEDKHVEQRIEVVAEKGADVKVLIDTNGEVKEFNLPNNVFADKDQLEQALADFPVEVRENLLKHLSGFSLDANMIKIATDDEHIFNWSADDSAGAKSMVVVKVDKQEFDSDDLHKVVKHIVVNGDQKVIDLKDTSHSFADVIINLIDDSKLSQEDMDKIQAALDKKR
ncbi:hypothetical protein [Thalassotalea fusca]